MGRELETGQVGWKGGGSTGREMEERLRKGEKGGGRGTVGKGWERREKNGEERNSRR